MMLSLHGWTNTLPCMVLTFFLLTGCRGNDSGDGKQQNQQDIITAIHDLMSAIPSKLSSDGPIAWLEFFEHSTAFYMASDGALAFSDIDAARTFLSDFADSVLEMDLEWEDLRVELLSDHVASIGAGYRERIVDTAGIEIAFGGYFTGMARKTEGSWRLHNLHWSSPVGVQ